MTIENLKDYRPEDLRYDDKGLWVGETFYECERPRLEFAMALEMFQEEIEYMCLKDGCMMAGNTSVGSWVEYGFNCSIGGTGFGYVKDAWGEWFTIPHLGNVVIEDNVTIHNNVNIDRGVVGSTVIGEGSKIDSLVHIAHNAKIGKRCLIVSGAVIGGSAEIGDDTFIGMNASIKNKVKIGANCTIGAGAVVTRDVPDNSTVIKFNEILKK